MLLHDRSPWSLASKHHHFLHSTLAPSFVSLYNWPPCEAPMPFSIRPYRRFPIRCSLTHSASHDVAGVVPRYRNREGTAATPSFREQAAHTEEESPCVPNNSSHHPTPVVIAPRRGAHRTSNPILRVRAGHPSPGASDSSSTPRAVLYRAGQGQWQDHRTTTVFTYPNRTPCPFTRGH